MKRLILAGLTLAVSLATLVAPPVQPMNTTAQASAYTGRHRADPAPAFASPVQVGEWRMSVRASL